MVDDLWRTQFATCFLFGYRGSHIRDTLKEFSALLSYFQTLSDFSEIIRFFHLFSAIFRFFPSLNHVASRESGETTISNRRNHHSKAAESPCQSGGTSCAKAAVESNKSCHFNITCLLLARDSSIPSDTISIPVSQLWSRFDRECSDTSILSDTILMPLSQSWSTF